MGLVKKPARAGHPDLALLHQELSQLIGRLVEFDRADRADLGDWLPSVDVFEYRGMLTVVIEVPGLSPDSLRVACSNGQLVVSGERRERRAAGVAGFLCMERPHGRFTRTILLDSPVDVPRAAAQLAGGLLTITLPRLKDRRGREAVIAVTREDRDH
jgi:HSP20 family molecular chaperone IbpA